MTEDRIRWAERAWQRPITEVRLLTGGWTSTMLRLTGEDGERAVLRLMTKEPWRRHATGLLTREAKVQQQLEPTRIPAPRSIAVDLTGTPAHLMTWLPGDLCLDDKGIVEPLARLLADIHAVDPGPGRPRAYESWAVPAKRVVPAWSTRPALWERAFRLLDRPAPAYAGTFLHRDFHLGNVLWSQGRVSGVVDWVETSWGPAGLDVAHAATYLAMLHGVETAARFTGLCGEPDRYWVVLDIVGYLPDPAKVVQPWRDRGLTVSDTVARRRLEQWLADRGA